MGQILNARIGHEDAERILRADPNWEVSDITDHPDKPNSFLLRLLPHEPCDPRPDESHPPLTLFWEGDRRNYVHIEDSTTSAVLLALELTLQRRIYDVNDGGEVPWREFAGWDEHTYLTNLSAVARWLHKNPSLPTDQEYGGFTVSDLRDFLDKTELPADATLIILSCRKKGGDREDRVAGLGGCSRNGPHDFTLVIGDNIPDDYLPDRLTTGRNRPKPSSKISHQGVREAIQAFEKGRDLMARMGACDAIPDALFQWAVAQAFLQTGRPLPPLSAWPLFRDDAIEFLLDADQRPRAHESSVLTLVAGVVAVQTAIADAIKSCDLTELLTLAGDLRRYCWRLDWNTVANDTPWDNP